MEQKSVAVPMKQPKAAKPKAKAKATKPSKNWAEKYRPGTIGRQIADAIVAGKLGNEQILEVVKKTHKGAKTTMCCVSWYKSAARKAEVIK